MIVCGDRQIPGLQQRANNRLSCKSRLVIVPSVRLGVAQRDIGGRQRGVLIQRSVDQELLRGDGAPGSIRHAAQTNARLADRVAGKVQGDGGRRYREFL